MFGNLPSLGASMACESDDENRTAQARETIPRDNGAAVQV
jgi:hypothetical protein